MSNDNEYLQKLIELVYTKNQKLIPFLDILRNDIRSLTFTADTDIESANIIMQNGKFDIIVNTNFIAAYELDDEDVLWLICHEIAHYALDHLSMSSLSVFNDHVRNIGLDCQINSLLYNLNDRNTIQLFEKANKINYTQFLENEDREGYYFLTVPPFLSEKKVINDLKQIDFDEKKKKLIAEFWFKNFSKEGLGIKEIFEYLVQIFNNPYNNEDEKNGENNKERENDNKDSKYGEEDIPEEITELMDKLLKTGKSVKSQSEQLKNIILDTEKQYSIKDNITILRNAINSAVFTKNNNISAINETIMQTIMPNLGRKEAVLLAKGLMPMFYNTVGDYSLSKDIAIYIDFSASTKPYHSKILNLINALRDIYSGKYYSFSDYVTEVSLDDLVKGKFETGGTDIEKVFENIEANGIKKALIISDGEFGIVNKTCKAELFIVLLDSKNSLDDIKNIKNVKNFWFLT